MLTLSTNIHEARLDGSLAKLPDDLDRAVEIGLGAVEVAVHGLDAIRAGRLDQGRVAAFLSIFRHYPLRLSVHAPDILDLMAPRDHEVHVALLDACLEFCERVGADVLVVHPGRWVTESDFGIVSPWLPGKTEQRERMEREAGLVRDAADRFPSVGIVLENARPYLPYSPYTYAEFPDRLREQIERIDRPNVGACLDTGHLHMSSRLHGFSEIDSVRSLAPWIRHLHVHDNFGRTGYWSEKGQTRQIPMGRGDLHMPPGLGDIDFESILAPVFPGFGGMVVCEVRERYLHGLSGHVAMFRELMLRLSTPD